MNKRINKTKDQLKAEILVKQDIEKEHKLAIILFPYLQKMETIYDAQTLLHGIAGYVHHELEKKMNGVKVNELPVDVSKEKEGVFRETFGEMLDLLKDEDADHTIKFMKRFGDMLGYFGAKEYMKNPMSMIKQDDLIKKPKVN